MAVGLVTISVVFIQVILSDASFGRVDSAMVGCICWRIWLEVEVCLPKFVFISLWWGTLDLTNLICNKLIFSGVAVLRPQLAKQNAFGSRRAVEGPWVDLKGVNGATLVNSPPKPNSFYRYLVDFYSISAFTSSRVSLWLAQGRGREPKHWFIVWKTVKQKVGFP